VAKKARAKGNAPATIANRVKRKAAVNKANLRENTRYGNVVDGKQYERQIKTSMTLDRAQNYLKTGQKGKPTEKARRALLAAKRAPEMAAARTRLDAKRAARRKADTGKPAAAKPAAAKRRGAVGKISEAKAGRIVARMDAQRGRKALPGRRNANFARTYERSRQFILKPSAAALKKGKPISVNESVQKAVANAAKRRKPKRRRS
jgi:hypothetical protein